MAGKSSQGDFVELKRTFHEVVKSEGTTDDIDQTPLLRHGKSLTWADVISRFRVIILSEAGSGKTVELQRAAMKLRRQHKAAFFLRLEHISDAFEGAFEVGTFAEFQTWLSTNDEGWMFLDSVDESRLRCPGDFESAVRKLGGRTSTALQRVHIVMTSRVSAWRPKTDADFCSRRFPYDNSQMSHEKQTLRIEDHLSEVSLSSNDDPEKSGQDVFTIIGFDDLGTEQIRTFVSAKGVANADQFLEAVERADAGSFTARPQDLEELASFWNEKGRIGTRLEVIRNSIKRRLSERDQTRAEAYPLSVDHAEMGARLLAASSTLGHEPAICVPDGSETCAGICTRDILPDWDDKKRITLLSRPIFVQGMYGTVRFHHRSVREFLTAEWLAELLKHQTSRRKIESLLFRNQYGVDVIVPTMRSVLPWLAILDEKIADRLSLIAPEVLFEGGDPSQLPVETRKKLLRQVCEQFASDTASGSVRNYSAVQRFANDDLVADIKELISNYASNDNLIAFLLRMIWIGKLRDALPEAKLFSVSSAHSKYTRIVAIRALRAVGSNKDLEELRKQIVGDSDELDREYLAELVYDLEPTPSNSSWLLTCLAKVSPIRPYSVDALLDAVTSFVVRADVDRLSELLPGFRKLLATEPVLERRSCEISQAFYWLFEPAVCAVKRLIEARHPASLSVDSLEILHNFPVTHQHHINDSKDSEIQLSTLVPAWSNLNRELFWYEVAKTRELQNSTHGEKLTDFWMVSREFWRFDKTDFDYAANQIADQLLNDDRLVALSLAFHLYAIGPRDRKQLNKLKKIVSLDLVLSEKLVTSLKPVLQGRQSYKQMQAKRKRQQEAWERKQVQNREEWRSALQLNPELVRNNGLEPGQVSGNQEYLFERMREHDKHCNRWTNGDWRCLIKEFGDEVAHAFRDGAKGFWRNYWPTLRSEGAPANSTPFAVLFGLTGLQIEATESPEWLVSLTPEEVDLACRYASHELNGFPTWFPSLLKFRELPVTRFLLQEIRHELSIAKPDVDTHYILYDISTSGEWAWDSLASQIYAIVSNTEPANVSNFGYLLNILRGSQVSDVEIARLAESKTKHLEHAERCAVWYAVWVGVDPSTAIPSLAKTLSKLAKKNRTAFAMHFITSLLGDRRGGPVVNRDAFKTPQHLKDLYLMMHQHIRANEDISRAGRGVFSPGLRDRAQDARNNLGQSLRNFPGKEAYVALCEIAETHPEEAYRPWFLVQAKAKAESDADFEAWSASQVRDFHRSLEHTPKNHRELADLVSLRLLDLKDDLENGDNSIAKTLLKIKLETEMRNFIGRELREKANGRYSIPQEEEFADAKRVDLRFHGTGVDGPVPCEMKLAEKWTAAKLMERLENQLCRDYLRDNRSSRGFFLLFFQQKNRRWKLPGSRKFVDSTGLLEALKSCWDEIASSFPGIDRIEVIGIDLTKRTR